MSTNKLYFSKKNIQKKSNSIENDKIFSQKIISNIIAYSIVYPYLSTIHDFNYYSQDVFYFASVISHYYKYYGTHGPKNSCFLVDPYDENKLYHLDDYCNSPNIKVYMETENIQKTFLIPYTTFLLEYLYSPVDKPEIDNWSQEQLTLFSDILEHINKNWTDKGNTHTQFDVFKDFPIKNLEYKFTTLHNHQQTQPVSHFQFLQNHFQQS
jgi:hypothetical protein